MKKISRVVYCCLAMLIVSSYHSFAIKGEQSPCSEELKNAYKAEADFLTQTLNSGSAWHLKYKMISNVLNPNTKKYIQVNSAGELIAGKHSRYMRTDNIEVFLDEKDVFTINRQNKSIMQTPSSSGRISRNDMYTALLQDSMLRTFNVVSCTPEASLIKYELVPRNKKTSSFTHVTVYIEKGTKIFKRMDAEMNLSVANTIRSYQLIIEAREAMKIDESWQHVRSRIFNTDGSLKPQYKGYTYREIKKSKLKK